jgi:diguanylate cyclase (GGDEF)-like protein
MIDRLTGVGNGRACSFLLRRVVSDGASLLAVEIDSFAQFNDTHSSPVGDLVIVEITRLLADALGGRGLLARTSGDGFRIILPTNELPAALAVGERLRRSVESWRWVGAGGEPEHAFTISVGVATCGQASVTCNTNAEARRLHSELEVDADRALHQAKAHGGNRVCTKKPGT